MDFRKSEIKGILTGAILILMFLIQFSDINAVPRFPKPEFESGYVQPPTQTPSQRSDFMEILDIFMLILSLSVITWFILKKRSRKGVFWVSIFSIFYFGFLREGCVCSVGSLQNIALALFNPGYKIPITVIAFFVIPLIYTLFFGRTFCAGVCPLGAIQDIFLHKPVSLKSWLQKALGLIPFVYLGLAVLYAATGTDFIICRYDPFIGIYRFDATLMMLVIGGVFLLTSIFIARPYCRFFCPYGALLKLISKVSKRHLTITPAECIQCRLCENSCPFGAIDKPEPLKLKETKEKSVKRYVFYIAIIPVLIFIGSWTGSQFHENMATVHPKVRLANKILKHENDTVKADLEKDIEIEAFKVSGKTNEELYEEANSILEDFDTGGIWLGGFLGLVFGLSLLSLSVYRYREDYVPDKGDCLSCGRCMDYCPVEAKNED